MTHPGPKRNMVPKVVLMRSSLVSLTTARPVNTTQPKTIINSTRPMTNVFNKAHSTVRRPINNKTATKNSNFNQKVNTARPKAVLNVVKGNQVNAVKASACWVWKPKTKGNPQQDLQEKGVIDSGCSRHMTGNMSYLTDFEEIDGGYVAFGDDYSRFSWVFFLATKDKTSGILKSFITGVENLIDQRVKVIRCDNGTEFKNKEMNQFCERKADSKLPTTFWAEAINTVCYVQNRVLVTKPHNKTPYELFLGRKPALGFMRPFGCPVTILNTIDHLGKFDGKADEGFFVGYSINSKAFRVFNSRTRIVEENLHVQFSENTPNIAGSGPNWLFDIDALTNSKSSPDAGFKPSGDDEKKVTEEPGKEGGDPSKEGERDDQEKDVDVNSTNNVYTVSSSVNTIGSSFINVDGSTFINAADLPDDPNMPHLEDIFYSDDDEYVGAEADMNNLDAFIPVSPIPTTMY
ncbi:putative ribonuclease H-like domain-containing protein [Tanacetum coccineum]